MEQPWQTRFLSLSLRPLETANATAYRESIGRTTPTQNPAGCLEEYLLDMTAVGNIPEPTWEAFRAWIVATPVDQMGI